MYNKENLAKAEIVLKHCFSAKTIHHITEANINFYANPFTHPKRTMKEHDFIYVIQGEWKFGQNGETYDLAKDSLLILSADQLHYGVSPCSAGTKTMYFHVTREAGDVSYADGDSIPKTISVIDACIDASTNTNIKKFFSRVVNYTLSGDERRADLFFELLLCELAEHSTHSASNDTIPDRIKKLIHSNPERFFSNKELADAVNTSVKTAETKFKRKFGISIHQYILNYKITEAISYFESFPQISIKETAVNLGFYDEYHFSKQFKKTTGKSPSQYKRTR